MSLTTDPRTVTDGRVRVSNTDPAKRDALLGRTAQHRLADGRTVRGVIESFRYGYPALTITEVLEGADDGDTVGRWCGLGSIIRLVPAPDTYARINEHADDIVCECGGNVLSGQGFYPAGVDGLVSPAVGSGWDGRTIACLDCGRLIDTDPTARRYAPAGDGWHPFLAPVTGRLAIVPTEIPN